MLLHRGFSKRWAVTDQRLWQHLQDKYSHHPERKTVHNWIAAQTSQTHSLTDTQSHRHNVSSKAMCCVCTLQHCTQLGVSHSRLFARGTNGPYNQEQHLFSQHTVYLVPSTTHSLPGPLYNTQSIPGPMPTLMMSAPLSISSSTISPVTTLPAYTHTHTTVCHQR